MSDPTLTRVLAIASAGGHWVQLRRMRLAWDECNVTYVTTNAGYKNEVMNDSDIKKLSKPKFYTVLDANRWQKLRLLFQLVQVSVILLRERPNVIISTGAAPGFFAIWLGKLFGAKTVWVDSIANASCLSLSGQKVGPYADLWLTQWERIAEDQNSHGKGLQYMGEVI